MAIFILRRFGVMILTALCLTFIVFFLTNLYPNLEKLAKTQGNVRMTDEQVEQWLDRRGYLEPLPVKYGQWLGVLPGFVERNAEGEIVDGRCAVDGLEPEDWPTFCGVLQWDWGTSTVFREDVSEITFKRLGLTGKLMFWVMLVMVPGALIIGVVGLVDDLRGLTSRQKLLAQAIVAVLLFFLLSALGVPFVTDNPAAALGLFVLVLTLAGMMLGGLVTLRPDQVPYIEVAREALRSGHHVLLVHARSAEQLGEARDLLERPALKTMRTAAACPAVRTSPAAEPGATRCGASGTRRGRG